MYMNTFDLMSSAQAQIMGHIKQDVLVFRNSFKDKSLTATWPHGTWLYLHKYTKIFHKCNQQFTFNYNRSIQEHIPVALRINLFQISHIKDLCFGFNQKGIIQPHRYQGNILQAVISLKYWIIV